MRDNNDREGEIEDQTPTDRARPVPYTPRQLGRLQGGAALNIVRDRAEMIFEFRHRAEDDPDTLRARIMAIAPEGTTIERLYGYPGLSVPPEADVTRLAQRLTGNQPVTKVAYGTEAGYFNALGIPTIVCGPGSMEGQGHKPDAYITRDQLAQCDAMLSRLLTDLCA